MAEIRKIESFGEEHQAHMNWARNTIGWAIAIRAEADGSPLGSEQAVATATGDAWELAEKLWMTTVRELGSHLSPASGRFYFSKRVLEWSASKMGYTPPAP